MSYHQFKSEDSQPYGSFEVFYHDGDTLFPPDDDYQLAKGWYWWACFPGCLPDGDPSGPFDTEEEAIADANDF